MCLGEPDFLERLGVTFDKDLQILLNYLKVI